MGLFSSLLNIIGHAAVSAISDDDGYNDTPDFGECPDCPECGATMRYSYCDSEFKETKIDQIKIVKCPDCGKVMDQDEFDWDEDDESEMPQCCIGCSDAYPNCKTSCSLFDD